MSTFDFGCLKNLQSILIFDLKSFCGGRRRCLANAVAGHVERRCFRSQQNAEQAGGVVQRNKIEQKHIVETLPAFSGDTNEARDSDRNRTFSVVVSI